MRPMLAEPVRFLILQVALGFLISATFVGAFLWADPGGAGTRMLTSAEAPWPVLALWLLTGLTFGTVQFGSAITLMAHAEEQSRGPANGLRVPVPVRVRPRRR